MTITEYLQSKDKDLKAIGFELVKESEKEGFREMMMEFIKVRHSFEFKREVKRLFSKKADKFHMSYHSGKDLPTEMYKTAV